MMRFMLLFVLAAHLAGPVSAQSLDTVERSIGRLPRAFGVVEKGRVYRSGQPLFDQLSNLRHDYGVKSILILHASMQDSIAQELLEARANNLMALQVPISDHEFPSDENLVAILKFLKEAPKPVLIHCRAGADRTGLVSAIYRHLFMGQDFREAKSEMLSIRWGHLWFGPVTAMDHYYLDVYPSKIEAFKQAMGGN
jgi:protein tyrosine/serine phosphatase